MSWWYDGENTIWYDMVKTRKYDGENMMVHDETRWRDVTMVKTRRYDDDNTMARCHDGTVLVKMR